jgi:hypothetical protein
MIIWNLCVIWYPYLEVMCHIIWLSGTYVSSDILIWKLCVISYDYLELMCHLISLPGSYESYHMIIWNLCVIWYPYLEIMYHILFLSGSYMSYHMFIWKLCVKFCKVPQLCIWSACTKWGEWMVMYMCVRCIDFTSVTMIFWLEVIWHCHIFCFSF